MLKHIMIIILSFVYLATSAQCIDNIHSPLDNSGWVSCIPSESPVAANGSHHWVLLDLTHGYTLDSLQLWNHNTWGETGQGVKTLQIDYKFKNSPWYSFGEVEVAEAPGSWKYQGEHGIALNGIRADKLLLTVLDAHDPQAACVGIGEIKIILGEFTTDVESLEDPSFVLYPNPASDDLYINIPSFAGKQTIEITNALGQTVMNRPFEEQINISNLNAGVYHLSIVSEHHRMTKTFIKINEE